VNARLRGGGTSLRIALAAAVGIVCGAGLLVWSRTELMTLSYDLTHLVEQEGALRRDVEKLKVESAALSARERIESRARRMGLRYPQPEQIVHLSRGQGPGDAQ